VGTHQTCRTWREQGRLNVNPGCPNRWPKAWRRGFSGSSHWPGAAGCARSIPGNQQSHYDWRARSTGAAKMAGHTTRGGARPAATGRLIARGHERGALGNNSRRATFPGRPCHRSNLPDRPPHTSWQHLIIQCPSHSPPCSRLQLMGQNGQGQRDRNWLVDLDGFHQRAAGQQWW